MVTRVLLITGARSLARAAGLTVDAQTWGSR